MADRSDSEDSDDPMMMPGHFGFSVWNKATGAIVKHGSCSFLWGAINQVDDPETQVYWGEELDGEKWAFDPATGQPIEVDRQISQPALRVAINRYRDVLISRGRLIDGVLVTGSDKDRANLESLAFGSQMRLAQGDTAARPFRDGNDIIHMLTPLEFIQLWAQAAQYVSDIYEKSWALKALTSIPQDIENPAYWPD